MYRLIFFAALVVFSCKTKQGSKTADESIKKNVEFTDRPVWQDEFDYAGFPDSTKWGYDTGGHGWGNNELQYYTSALKNVHVANGKLIITAVKERHEGMNYTSTRLISKNKGDFLYGRIEVRAKLPSGRGTWPAIWMLPTDWEYGDWPISGEIDIMEHVGYDPNNVLFSIHTESYNHTIGTQRSGKLNIPTAMTDFHNYRVDWTPEEIRGYFDDQHVFTFANEKTGYKT